MSRFGVKKLFFIESSFWTHIWCAFLTLGGLHKEPQNIKKWSKVTESEKVSSKWSQSNPKVNPNGDPMEPNGAPEVPQWIPKDDKWSPNRRRKAPKAAKGSPKTTEDRPKEPNET